MIPLSPNCKLAVVGLGQSDILTGTHCAHGLSNPLKIYLSLLNEGTYSVIVDGVAGLDMVNF
jgi:hypothetical protein